jgi:NAD(P)-dependent dehydrogenase (short-subunit alcohol dehydrogenase family)
MTRYAKSTVAAIGAGAALVLLGAARARARRKRLAGQVVLITGGSRGFGLALAREFATLQCRIALCARDHDELERAQATLARADCEVFTVACDVSDRDGVAAMVDTVSRHYGHIDILVNDAGEIMVSRLKIWK